MPPSSRINGTALASMVAGTVLVYSGITGKGILQSIRSVVSGQSPSSIPQTYPISGQDSTVSTAASVSYAGPTSGGGSVSSNQALAQQIAVAMGHSDWTTGQEWSDWDSLWTRESGWSATATNPTSGAYGIPQSLPASKMASAGSDWQTNPATQIKWGIGYIAEMYGSPSKAEAHENQFGWY